MPEQLVPLRVSILRGSTGNDYPDFDRVPLGARRGMKWTRYVDKIGGGWNYDRVAGFGKSDAYSPDPGVCFGLILVYQDFAQVASSLFPGRVIILSEADAEVFWDTRAHVEDEEFLYDAEVLQALAALDQLEGSGRRSAPSQAERNQRSKALDPDQPTRGVRRNPHKTWASFKVHREFQVP